MTFAPRRSTETELLFWQEAEMSGQIADELAGINLGDKRLNERSVKVIKALGVDPAASINGSIEKWSDTLAAYRLFDNANVTPEAILQPHYNATIARIAEERVVLIVQDTTELDFSKHPPKDAGCLNKANRFGLYNHTHLAVTPTGLPLGVVGVRTFDRTEERLGETRNRSQLPIEEKESFRWLEGYRLAGQVSEHCPQTQIVSVADREADIYDIFMEAQQEPEAPRADFVIRSKEQRSINERIPPSEHGTRNAVYRKFRDDVSDSPVRMRQTITLPQTPKRAARECEVEIRAKEVTLRHPKNRKGLPDVPCRIVYVKEIGIPENGDSPVEWWLITSLPVPTNDDVQRVIDYYKARWTVEVYFKVLKSGCKVEDIQLETTARLRNSLAFYQIIAWRVLYLTYLNRECPTMPCTVVFEDYEWQPVWRVSTKKELPAQPPTLSEFMGLLSSLGGYNNRAKEGPPGPQPIWVGLRRMADFARAWLAFGPPTHTYV
jgi:hypothetical protein